MLLTSLRVQLLALMLLGLYINLRVMALDPHMDKHIVLKVMKIMVQAARETSIAFAFVGPRDIQSIP